ncbi:hypothetical protein SGGMMB4_04243 [Sodalis glossinidius str. 'morsitans']|uniref:DUF4282 domain-containing protein n=1 Tax=Sodalis glossinidius (strain morsitans) TaxID=343509 RepID=A0A193QI18_SODGM|nr:hypothetical protein [Sodalis glossinidius]CRL44565.1 hypothetical protein SGGMMB4_01724 [Sodalis glossinidius str. 'morsitans']CRL46022.1 hypothetical protein SGGMMB4_04243 [Sodalis glossinidius str. 'morsitans']
MFKTFWTLKIINVISIMTWIAAGITTVIGIMDAEPKIVIFSAIALMFSRLFLECIAVQFVQAETLNKILDMLKPKEQLYE